MASGKQLSFQYGEVSPSLRYKSDAVSYAQGLGKLRNFYVRRAGGVSNRPGFEFIQQAISQRNIPVKGGKAGIKGYTFWSPNESKWKTVEYAEFFNIFTSVWRYGFAIDGTPEDGPSYLSPTPDLIRFTSLKDGKVFVTPEQVFDAISPDFRTNTMLQYDSTAVASNYYIKNFNYGIGDSGALGAGSTSYSVGTSGPYMPVSYLVTVTMADGTERYLTDQKTSGYTPAWTGTAAVGPTNVYHPHANMSVTHTINLNTGLNQDAGITQVNLYRAAGAGGLNSSYFKLVGRVPYAKGAGTVTLQDYGAEANSITPPIDKSMLDTTNTYFAGAVCAAYYQQRLIMGMKPGTTESIKAGDVLASKLGAPEQIKFPLVYTDTGAFQFSVPVTDGTPVVAALAMERLILFTERGVHIVRGGEQGILTPTTTNPLCLSDEGCSSTVEPSMAGKHGYFLNSTHTKLMSIKFGLDANVNVTEATLFSDHFLQEDAIQLVTLGGGEDTVYVLRRDGKMIRITISEDGAHGFSLVETEGYIESIYRGKAKRPYAPNALDLDGSEKYFDVLIAYVIRNGVRSLERMVVRDDRHMEGELFADCSRRFGSRLMTNGNLGYKRILDEVRVGYIPNSYLNIGSPATLSYLAGAVIEIYGDSDPAAYERIHFFYEDVDGVTRTLRFTPDPLTSHDDGTTFYVSGTFDQDVPALLQDVNTQGLGMFETHSLRRRWLPAFNTIEVDSSHAAMFPEGTAVPVAIFADGEVISSPLNPNKPVITMNTTIASPVINLGDYYCYGYFGLPYTSEFETMDLEAGGERTLTDSNKLLNAVGVGLVETRQGFFGIPNQSLVNMEELALEGSGDPDEPITNTNGHHVVHIPTEWQEPGRITIKQVDPAPMTIVAVYPKGISGD